MNDLLLLVCRIYTDSIPQTTDPKEINEHTFSFVYSDFFLEFQLDPEEFNVLAWSKNRSSLDIEVLLLHPEDLHDLQRFQELITLKLEKTP